MAAASLDRLAIVLVGAGSSTRMGFDKVWADLDGRPLAAWALAAAVAVGAREIVLVVHPSRLEDASTFASGHRDVVVVPGGERRRDSVAAGLAASVAPWVAVHDVARALAPSYLYQAGLEAAARDGAAVPTVPVVDTIKRVHDGRVVETLPREALVAAQTPQVFRRDVLERALGSSDADVTDEATLVEALGRPVATFDGSPEAFKVTTPLDLERARLVARARVAQGAEGKQGSQGVPLHPGPDRPLRT